jgi:hypothetical protein
MLGAKNPLTFGNVEFRDNYQALGNIFKTEIAF